jgi:hypothetical protein
MDAHRARGQRPTGYRAFQIQNPAAEGVMRYWSRGLLTNAIRRLAQTNSMAPAANAAAADVKMP